jgi:soluble cytochrome b562
MRKAFVFAALHLALLSSVLSAQFEISADDMRTIEDTVKSLDSNVALKDKAALAEARELSAYFKQVETFYAATPETADAVGFARKSHALADAAAKAIEAGEFDTAAESVGQLTRSCKTCHDVYKNK